MASSIVWVLLIVCHRALLAQDQELSGAINVKPDVPSTELPAGNWAILDAAVDKLHDHRERFSHADYSKYVLFPNSQSLHQGKSVWGKHFEVVQGATKVPGKQLRLSQTAQLGDVVLIDETSNDPTPRVLVYVGDNQFPDQKDKKAAYSFFVYPYLPRTGLELNTFPPRLTFDILQKYDVIHREQGSIPTFKVSNTDRGARFTTGYEQWGLRVSWLRSPPMSGSLFVQPSWWKNATYRILRSKAAAESSAIADLVRKALEAFEAENPGLKGKAYLTSGARTWQEQLDIILDPKRKDNYLNIKGRFLKRFSLSKLPSSRASLTAEQLKWWETEIMAQAGKSPGFPHVGGKAQDVSVKNLDVPSKKKLKAKIESQKLKILLERVTGSSSEYGVTIEQANVFHVYQ